MSGITPKKVLIVDDNPVTREIITSILSTMSLGEVTQSEGGDLAWRLIEKAFEHHQPFSLVISDFDMPFGTGLELLRKVRKDARTQDLPFIILSAHAESDLVIKSRDLKVSAFITKPISPSEIERKINSLFTEKH